MYQVLIKIDPSNERGICLYAQLDSIYFVVIVSTSTYELLI